MTNPEAELISQLKQAVNRLAQDAARWQTIEACDNLDIAKLCLDLSVKQDRRATIDSYRAQVNKQPEEFGE